MSLCVCDGIVRWLMIYGWIFNFNTWPTSRGSDTCPQWPPGAQNKHSRVHTSQYRPISSPAPRRFTLLHSLGGAEAFNLPVLSCLFVLWAHHYFLWHPMSVLNVCATPLFEVIVMLSESGSQPFWKPKLWLTQMHHQCFSFTVVVRVWI